MEKAHFLYLVLRMDCFRWRRGRGP